jgi:hypothetical protein
MGGKGKGSSKSKVVVEEEADPEPPPPVQAPQPVETPPPTTDAPVGVDPTICAEDDVQTFTQSVLLSYIGRAEDIDELQITTLEDSFLLAYNELSDMLCPERSFSVVVEVQNPAERR